MLWQREKEVCGVVMKSSAICLSYDFFFFFFEGGVLILCVEEEEAREQEFGARLKRSLLARGPHGNKPLASVPNL